MELVGYIAASLIGISLGLIGGGGSILTLPVLVYFLHVEPLVATSYSLFIVGITSSLGALMKSKQVNIALPAVVLFGVPSMLAVVITRRYILPAIPDKLPILPGVILLKPTFILLLFALLMVIVALNMILTKSHKESVIREKKAESTVATFNPMLLVVAGVVEGALSGLVGAGGGFLIIPALVMLAQIPMREAIGTSLLIVGVKSLIGFIGDVPHLVLDWKLLLAVALMTLLGFMIGHKLSRRMSSQKLKLVFGYFVLVMGLFVFVKEIMTI